jgi:hypothetical protein
MDEKAVAAAGEWLAREWDIPLEEARGYVERWSVEEDAKDLVTFFFLHCSYPWYGEHPPYEAELTAAARCE